jgi:cation:H+ antiporter
MLILYGILVIVVSSAILYIAGELLVAGLLKLSRYFRVTEFIVAFFVMALAASLPNLFVGVNAALQGIPELSFGDIMGNNMIALTLAIALGIFFAPKRELPLENQTIRDTTFLTSLAAILPLILISDGTISRSDGLILVLFFVGYMYWMLSKRERFTKAYAEERAVVVTKQEAWGYIWKVIAGVVLLAIAAQGIVHGATILAGIFDLPLLLIGILVIGFGGALPEIYFTVLTARRGETAMIVGNLMGAVIIPATLVLGLVAIIHPIHNEALELSIVGRMFLVAAALFFLVVSQTRSVITSREGYILLFLYLAFLAHLFIVS